MSRKILLGVSENPARRLLSRYSSFVLGDKTIEALVASNPFCRHQREMHEELTSVYRVKPKWALVPIMAQIQFTHLHCQVTEARFWSRHSSKQHLP